MVAAGLQGTVLLRNAEELQSYSRSEEDRMEELIKGIADSGAKIVVAGSSIGEMAMHFVEKYGLMAVRIPSKFDLRRFCRQAPPPPPPPFTLPSPWASCALRESIQHVAPSCLLSGLFSQARLVEPVKPACAYILLLLISSCPQSTHTCIQPHLPNPSPFAPTISASSCHLGVHWRQAQGFQQKIK